MAIILRQCTRVIVVLLSVVAEVTASIVQCICTFPCVGQLPLLSTLLLTHVLRLCDVCVVLQDASSE